MVRTVPEEEAVALRPPSDPDERKFFAPVLTPSLEEALRWFVLAAAARNARLGGSQHATMLIHVSQFVASQDLLSEPVRKFIGDLESAVKRRDGATLALLRRQWDSETARVPAEDFKRAPVSFGQLLPQLDEVLASTAVVVDNSRSPSRLIYDNEAPRPVVVIGGNTLSRGVTLEGLVVSYFVRTAGTYDTLLQMGRWFGYRRGYEDLPRIWTTRQLEEWFGYLALVESEVRRDIARYELENLTPLDAAVRIRTHPKLAITSALKMKNAVELKMSLSGQRPQTILFYHRDADWLAANKRAAERLLSGLVAQGIRCDTKGPYWVLKDVPVEAILEFFLNGYRFHEANADLRSDVLSNYIRAQVQLGELLTWNVVVVSRASNELGTIDLGLPRPVNLIARAKLAVSPPEYANINTLMSRVDRVADLDVERPAELSDAELLRLRTESGRAVLLLYPISKDSQPDPRRPNARRAALDAVDHVIGLAVAFPLARLDPTPQSYRVVLLPERASVEDGSEEPVPACGAEEDGEADFDGTGDKPA
ncbi:MAG: hypothetical protein C4321_07955 [Chloroflexota bacterium]